MKRTMWTLLVTGALVVLGAGALAPVAGAVTFGARTDFATGLDPAFVITADLNADGDLDVATTNLQAASLSVLLGNGTGSLGPKSDFGTGSSPIAMAAGDLDGDGDQDLVTANYSAQTISLLLGAGDGTFGAKTDYPAGEHPGAIAVGDFNGDRKLDVAVGNEYDSNVGVFLGTGNAVGTLGAQVTYAVGSHPYALATADVNGDGVLDIVSTDDFANTVSVLLGVGDGTFGAAQAFATGVSPYGLAIADVDGDGELDLATANSNAGSVSVLPGAGDGTFGPKTDYAVGSYPCGISAADFNGDGSQDIVASNNASSSVSVLLGAGAGGLQGAVAYSTNTMPESVATGDLDGDGRPDIVAGSDNGNVVSVLLNQVSVAPSGSMQLEGGAAAAGARVVHVDSLVAEATQMRVRDAGGQWSAWSAYHSGTYWTLPAGDGERTVEAQYRNSVGTSPVLGDSVLLDTTAPSSADDALNGWRTAGVNVALTASDGTGSGVARIEYRLDGAAVWTAGVSVAVAGDGAHTLRYRAVDLAGNKQDVQFATVRIDTAAPVVQLSGVDDAWHNAAVLARFAATDVTSGVSMGLYKLDGGAWTPGWAVALSEDGDHKLMYKAADVAENEAAEQTAHVRIDTHKPATSGQAASGRHGKKVTFKVKVTDFVPGSPSDTVVIKVKNARGKVVFTMKPAVIAPNVVTLMSWPKCSLKAGAYKYVVYATDAAGNAQSKAGGNKLVVR